MDFRVELKALVGQHLANTESLQSEEDTKRVLILPFIEALGYDTRNPAEFRSEVSASGGRVDFAIFHDGKPVIIFECKQASNANLTDERGQLRRYFNASKPTVAVLTNGVRYQFFSDLDRDGEMDSAPFLEVDLRELDEDDFQDPGSPQVNALRFFTKAEFSSENTRSAATQLKYKRDIRQFLEQQLGGGALNDDFVVLLTRQVYRGNATARIRAAIAELTTEVIGELRVDLAKSATTHSDNNPTADEVEGYFIVKNILWNVVDSDRVVMRDGSSYCTIQLDPGVRSRKRICLLRFNQPDRKRIGLLDGATEEAVSITSVGQINDYADRIRQTARQILEREK